ncbi:MAG TPA: PepSY-associated TM helix domain-containing protein [Verrucomicrobiae bacterium]|nr:PepSY-associated TM helix domain-containing protein [Verrucomicrobiae bacterium]
MRFRSIIFWLHLCAGVIAGVVIAIMSFTGAALAFEKQITAWAERDSRTVAVPAEASAARLPIDDLVAAVREKQGGHRPATIVVANDPAAAVMMGFGRTNSVYVNPYTGTLQPVSGQGTRTFMHVMIEWHRYLGRHDGQRATGKAITGACNAAFAVLAITGLYLWWPRKWNAGVFRSVAVMTFRLRGKARDWNWHNAVGFWTAPILIVLTLTAMPISYQWAGNLIYRMTGSPVPQPGPPGAATPAVVVPAPADGTRPLRLNELLLAAQREVPGWKEITLRLGTGGRGGAGRRNPTPSPAATTNESTSVTGGMESQRRAEPPQPVMVAIRERQAWPLFSSVQLTFDPFTGSVLRKETFSNYNLGRQVRSWTRFLHTGEALGYAGQFVAGLASLVSLLLVWTGFALTWRRFFSKTKS